MSIRITKDGLEIDNPTVAELAMLDKVTDSIRAGERERVEDLFEGLDQHDDDCYFDGLLVCYPDECSAHVYQHVLRMIRGEVNV